MNVYYNIEIQMAGMNKMTDDVLSMITRTLCVDDSDYDELEAYRAVLFFKTDMLPGAMRELVKDCLRKTERIHYIDVIYRFETEMNVDRYVIWADGREQDYTGHTIFEEDK